MNTKLNSYCGTRIRCSEFTLGRYLFDYWWTFALLVVLTTAALGLPNSADIQGPVFIQEPSDQVDFSNTTGTGLSCAVHGIPKPVITWLLSSGILVTNVPGLREIYSNGTLVFYPFRPEEYRQDIHATVYRCKATNAVGSVISRNVYVRAVVKQYYEVHVYDEFVIRGNTAVFKCNIPSFVRDYVTVTSWVKNFSDNAQQSIRNGGRYSVHSSGELHIRNAQDEDGIRVSYLCKTEHRLTGVTKLSFSGGRLIVTDPASSVPPRITHGKNSVTALDGDTVELPCAAQGYPLPTYSWRRSEGGVMKHVILSAHVQLISGSLLIRNSKISDGGSYLCIVNNTVGEEKLEVELKITSPVFVFVEPQKQVIDVGKSASFQCTYSGFPISDVQWMKDGRPLVSSPRIRFLSRESLHIDAVQREDRGMYQCFVTSGQRAVQAPAELRLGDAKPQMLQTFERNVLQPGSGLSLSCVTSGNPPPQVKWTVDGTAIQSTDRHLLEQQISLHGDVISYVNISAVRPEDGGEYQCTAVNRVGSVANKQRIDIYGIPFVRVMQNVSAVAGSTLSIRCLVAGYPIRGITWEREESILPVNHRQKVFSNGTLQVLDVQRPTDAGMYTCAATGDDPAKIARGSVHVSVMDPPQISPFSFPRGLQEGMRASITCSVFHGDLPISVSWLKDGSAISHGADLVIRGIDDLTSTLVVQRITPKDNGNYTCEARNTAATVNYTGQLLVLVPPRWIHEPKESSVVSGKSIIIDCQADGFPQPSVAWRKAIGRLPGDYVPIDYSSGRNYMYPNGSLWLTSIQDQDDGYYLCQANNSVGAGLSKVIHLKVHAPPHFEEKFRNQTVRRGHEAVLRCECKGDKPISIEWKINNQRVDMKKKNKYSIQEDSAANGIVSRLNVAKTTREDTTEFSCIASNDYGKAQTWIYLIVQEPPEAPLDVKVTKQSSRILGVRWQPPFDGNSRITQYVIQVKPFNAVWLTEKKNVSVPANEAVASVVDLRPAVIYHVSVAAENSIGLGGFSQDTAVTMDKEAPDGWPLNISVEPLGSQSLKVQWKPPKRENWNGDISSYRIGHRLFASEQPYNFATVTAKSDRRGQHIIDGLAKFTKYGVVVQATNEIGTGPLSSEIPVSTLEDVPSQPPRSIKCVPTSSQTLHMSWTPPAQQSLNGILRGYRVVYKPIDEHNLMNIKTKSEVRTSENAEIYLKGLEKYTNYSIHVQAFTGAGDGTKSLTVHCRTKEDVPGPPADIKVLPMSSDAIIVSWIPPKNPNGIITKYTIYMRTIEDYSKSASSFTLPPSQFYYEARSLSENLQYEFWLKASTVVGEGDKTRIISNSPVSTVPARIASFSQIIFAKRKDDVKLPCRAVGIPTPDREWLYMGQPLGSSSRAQVAPDGSLLIANYRSTDGGNFTCQVENIYAKDEVTHIVINKPNKGDEYPPSPPTLKIKTTTPNSITVSWKLEDFEELPVIGMTLNYKKDAGDWEEMRLESAENTYTLTNLACGTRYHIFMAAFNRFGSSDRSDMITESTSGKAPLAPEKDAILEVNTTFVSLQLSSWPDGGCPIFHFSVEYRERDSLEWVTVANKISPTQSVMITDLSPRTYYNVRINAINGAGATAVEFDFVTLKTGNDYSNEEILEGPHTSSKFYFDLNVLVPVVSAIIIIIVAILLVACIIVRRRRYSGYFYSVRSVRKPEHGNHLTVRELPQKLADPIKQNDNHDYDQTYTPSQTRKPFENKSNLNPNDVNNSNHDDISPYATFQLPSGRYEDLGDVRFHTFGYDGQIVERPTSPQFQYTKVRKKSSHQSSQQMATRGIPMNVRPSASKEHLNPLRTATMKTELSDTCSSRDEPIVPSAPPAEFDSCPSDSDTPDIAPPINRRGVRTLNYVPDILDHRPESSSSNESTPEADSGSMSRSKQTRNREMAAIRPRVISLRKCTMASVERCSSPESGAEEVSFTIHNTSNPPPNYYDEGDIISRQNRDQNRKSPSCLAAVEEELIALLKIGAEHNTMHKEESSSYNNINV